MAQKQNSLHPLKIYHSVRQTKDRAHNFYKNNSLPQLTFNQKKESFKQLSHLFSSLKRVKFYLLLKMQLISTRLKFQNLSTRINHKCYHKYLMKFEIPQAVLLLCQKKSNKVSQILSNNKNVQLIQYSKENQKVIYECSQSALQSSRLLLNLLNDLLDMSQIKAGKFKLVLENFNLCDLLMDVQQMMQPLAKNKFNQIVVQFDESLQNKIYNIRSDQYRIRQILINLISNSIKYTSHGQIFLILSREKLDERYFRIAVRDEGSGIKQEFRAKLFQAFGQAEDMESKTKNNPQGVGLGLMISNTIAKNLKPKQNYRGNSMNQQQIRNGSQTQFRSQMTPSLISQQSIRTTLHKTDTLKESRISSNQIITNCPSPYLNSDEGLVLNEELEKGTEFYFILFNYSSVDSQLRQMSETRQSRKLSIILQLKRPSIFSQHDSSLTEQSPSNLKDSLSAEINKIILHQQRQSVKKKSLDAFDSEVNSSEEESHSSSSNDSQGNDENINEKITKDDLSTSFNTEQFRPSKMNFNSQSTHQDMQNDGIVEKQSSQISTKFKYQYQSTNQQKKKKVSSCGQRKFMNQDLENIIRRNTMLKKQYCTFFDTEVNILIVDDDTFSALALKSKVTSAFKLFNKNIALSFTTLYSGAECIKELQMKQKAYSFLFIDEQMPDLSGLETIRLIDSLELRKTSFSSNKDNPREEQSDDIFRCLQVILCSGFYKEETQLYLYSIKYFLQKPVDQIQLINIIKQIFIENSLFIHEDELNTINANSNLK